ncbi:hypothetical protein [Niallia taxi]|uniref:hypothetical protein n=1 Tax=Niallia taxi TaxID=2499688 RepID=UPI00300B196C
MKSYHCRVEKVDKYIVELDETVFTEEWMEAFRQVWFPYYTLEQHAEHISYMRSVYGMRDIEGYGIPLENGELPNWADEKDVNKAINIKVISEDDNIDIDVEDW